VGSRITTLLAAARLAVQQRRYADGVGIYGEILQQQPSAAIAWEELGRVLKETRQYDLALVCYEQLNRISPDNPEGYLRSAEIWEDRGRSDLALCCYQKACQRSSDSGLAIQAATSLPAMLRSVEEIPLLREQVMGSLMKLDSAEELIHDPLRYGRVFFYLAYHGLNDKVFQQSLAETYRRVCPVLSWTAPHCALWQGRPAGQKIRIVFVSRFFYDHTISKLNRGLIKYLDRSHFEVHVVSLGPNDEVSSLIASGADSFRHLTGSLATIRQEIARLEADIIFYPDIGMEPLTYFLGFARLAPVQCVTWGHPTTTGISTIDWFVSHELCEAGDGQENYSERLFKISCNAAICCYLRPELGNLTPDRSRFGLENQDHIYLCPQPPFKFHPDFDQILADILRQDPMGKLVLIGGRISEHEQIIRGRLASLVPDQQKRVVVLPRLSQQEYLNLLATADVILDTIHFCGGNSSAEALAVGTPILTLPSLYLKGRLTAAWYAKMGMPDLVAGSAAEYVQLAVALGTDSTRNAQTRQKIQDKAPAIFDDMNYVHEMESFFRFSLIDAQHSK
jgi:predicted O-linked N-acetylglucosamine transferase (SPINDLY family)